MMALPASGTANDVQPIPASHEQQASVRAGRDVELGCQTEKSRSNRPGRVGRFRAGSMHLCAVSSGWLMVGILATLVLGLIAALLVIFLTGGSAWATYKTWEEEHAYDRPVHAALARNFPDPVVLHHDGVFYAFATNDAAGILHERWNISRTHYGLANIQLALSKDHFATWALQTPAQQPLPHAGAWADVGMTKSVGAIPAIPRAQAWSPGVVRRATDKRWVLYYAAARTPEVAVNATRRVRPGHCIGAAVSRSRSPLGPYQALGEPLVCDLGRGGAIDPSPFRDKDGTLWLAYKIDGNHVGHGGACGNMVEPIVSTPIMLQKMSEDGISPVGPPLQILDRTDSDGPLVEALSLVRSKEGMYFLFFSSGCTRDSSYDVKYATAEDIAGPYVRAPKALLRSGDWGLDAPGSPSVFKNPDAIGHVIAFHSRVDTAEGAVRAMSWSKLWLEGRHARLVE